MSDLDAARDEIRGIDGELLALLRRRNEAARRIGALKRERGLPLQNFEVEKSVLDHALDAARAEGVHEETTRSLVRVLIEAALRVQESDADVRAPKRSARALVVGGAGLMGAWFCRFLEERGYEVHVDDPQPSPYPGPAADGAPYALVLVATPPSTLADVIARLGVKLEGATVLADIGSVKADAAGVLRRLAKKGKHVASLHPMFGPKTDRLMGRNVLVLDAGDPTATGTVAELFERTAARTLRLPLEEHDALMGEVLTLAHATSLVFNHALSTGRRSYKELEPLASTTFRRQVEVSREVATENPKLYFEIQALNPASEAVLSRLETSVAELRRIVVRRDEGAFLRFMRAGARVYEGAA